MMLHEGFGPLIVLGAFFAWLAISTMSAYMSTIKSTKTARRKAEIDEKYKAAITRANAVSPYPLSSAPSEQFRPMREKEAYRLADDTDVSLFDVVQAAEREAAPQPKVLPANTGCSDCGWETIRALGTSDSWDVCVYCCARHR